MDQSSYRIIHLSNGTTLYTHDDYEIPEAARRDVTSVTGLDDVEYSFLDNEVVLTHLSTPESRHKLNELKHMLQTEVAAFTHGKMMAMQEEMEKQQAAMGQQHKDEQRTQSAVDRVMGKTARPVQLS